MELDRRDQENLDEAAGVAAVSAAVLAGVFMAGPALLFIAGFVWLLTWWKDRLLVPALALVVGAGLVMIPVNEFMGRFWGVRFERLKSEFFGLFKGGSDQVLPRLANIFVKDALAIELLAVGFLAGGVLGIGYWCYRRSTPAKRAFLREKREGRDLGASLSRRVLRKAEKVGKHTSMTEDRDGYPAIVIGTDVKKGKPVVLPWSSLNTHAAVGGTTGSGKTVTIANIVEAGIQENIPVFFVNGKEDADLRDEVEAFAKEHDRPFWGFTMRGESCKYNPLESGGFTSKKDRIIGLREWSEAFYKSQAESYLQTVFKVLDTVGQPVDLFTLPNYLDCEKLLDLLRERQEVLGAKALGRLKQEVEAQKKTEKNVDGLRSDLFSLARSEYEHLFDTLSSGGEVIEDDKGEDEVEAPPVLRLKEVIERKGVAYINLSPMYAPEYARGLGAMFLNDLKSCLPEDGRRDMLLVIDEFATFPGPQVVNLLNQGRSKGVHGVLTFQTLADLSEVMQRNASMSIDKVIGNCNVFLIHRMNSAKEVETLAGVVGKEKVEDVTYQTEGGRLSGGENTKFTWRNVIEPSVIQSLGKGQAVLYDKNTGVVARLLGRFGWLVQ